MSIGELWVAHPFFTWLVIILALWVAFSTAVMVRNWVHILRLKQHNKLLQEMVIEGVGSIAKRITVIEKETYLTEPAPTEVQSANDFPSSGSTKAASSEATCQTG